MKSAPRSSARLVRDLRQLIEAIDRRRPQLERHGETTIADDAKTLRDKALRRIAELEPARNRQAVSADAER